MTTLSLREGVGRVWLALSNALKLRPQNQEERNMQLLYFNTTMVGVASGGIVAFLPVFLARLGASPTLISWLTSGPSLAAVLFLLPGALVAERSSDLVKVRIKWVTVVLMAYLACAIAPFFVAVEQLPYVLVGIWVAKVLAEAVAIPAWTAVMSMAVSAQNRARVNGTRWALMSLAMALSSAFFGWMLDHVSFPINYQLVFFISFIFGLIDPLFFRRIVVDSTPVVRSPSSLPLRERVANYIKPVMTHKPFMVYQAVTFLYRIALYLPIPLYTLLWVNELEAADTLIGLRGTLGSLALVVGYLFWGRVANRFGHRRMLYICAAGLGVYVMLSSLIPSAWWILPLAVLWGATIAGVDVALFDIMLGTLSAERQALFGAFWSMEANFCMFLGPLIGAALMSIWGVRTTMLVGGIAQIVTTAFFLWLPRD
ncbi:MAG: MFS transporter [Chloroflexi bacterium]|nr:MFS transporter [Chloroflexota bacterium]